MPAGRNTAMVPPGGGTAAGQLHRRKMMLSTKLPEIAVIFELGHHRPLRVPPSGGTRGVTQLGLI